MNLAPIVRILLRYVVGALFIGSEQAGVALATDPDLVQSGAIALGALIEGGYALAKRQGWAT